MSSIPSESISVLLLIVVASLFIAALAYIRRRQAAQPEIGRELRQAREDRAKAQQELDLARTYFQNIIGISEDAIVSADARQRITLFNQGAERIFGFRADEALGQPLSILIPPRFHDDHDRHVQGFAASPEMLRPMSSRRPLVGRRKDGTEFPVEASITKFQVRGEWVFTARLRDVTEQRRAEESSRRLAAIVECSDDAIIGKTLDGTIVDWNAAAERLYGYTASEVIGRPISILMPPDRHNEMREILAQMRRGERLSHFQTVRVRKDGTRLDVSLSVSPVTDASGRVVAAAAIARDITEQKRWETQVHQTQKMEALGTLAGGIAHDFNNVLGAIIGHTELAIDYLAPGSPPQQELEEVLTAGKRATDLVRQILTFSRRAPEKTLQPVDLQGLVREVMRLMRASLPSTIEFRQQIESGHTAVLADASQLHQVLMNLCANAEHAMRGRPGLLEVQLKTVEVDEEFAESHPPLHPGTHARLMVRDTGEGMTPEIQERIFDPFFTTKPAGEGTGMGLAVVHGILRAHGGAITVESASNRGTRFDIYLRQASGAVADEPVAGNPPRGHQERILFVDDEPSLVRVWKATLEHFGYRVTSCSDGRDALEVFRAQPNAFDLVVTDQTMPEMAGDELVRELRRMRPDIPIILCSGSTHGLTEEKAGGLGVQAYLAKPVARLDLCAAIQRLLAEHVARPFS